MENTIPARVLEDSGVTTVMGSEPCIMKGNIVDKLKEYRGCYFADLFTAVCPGGVSAALSAARRWHQQQQQHHLQHQLYQLQHQ